MKIAVDAGRSAVKTWSGYSPGRLIESWIGKGVELAYGYQDKPGYFRLEYPGEDGVIFLGELARKQSSNKRRPFYKTKAHTDNLYLTLAAIFQEGVTQGNVEVALPIPFNLWNEKEINNIRQLFEKEHRFFMNDVECRIRIDRVRLAPEAVVASHLFPVDVQDKKCRILEVGHATSSYATFDPSDGGLEFNNRESGVINEGWGTDDNPTPQAVVQMLVANAFRTWERSDVVMLIGGVADKLVPYVSEHFDTEIIVPEMPRYANAQGIHMAFWG